MCVKALKHLNLTNRFLHLYFSNIFLLQITVLDILLFVYSLVCLVCGLLLFHKDFLKISELKEWTSSAELYGGTYDKNRCGNRFRMGFLSFKDY